MGPNNALWAGVQGIGQSLALKNCRSWKLELEYIAAIQSSGNPKNRCVKPRVFANLDVEWVGSFNSWLGCNMGHEILPTQTIHYFSGNPSQLHIQVYNIYLIPPKLGNLVTLFFGRDSKGCRSLLYLAFGAYLADFTWGYWWFLGSYIYIYIGVIYIYMI